MDCTEFHQYLCVLRIPNCPQGYTYQANLGVGPLNSSLSCFKITNSGGYVDSANGKMCVASLWLM